MTQPNSISTSSYHLWLVCVPVHTGQKASCTK